MIIETRRLRLRLYAESDLADAFAVLGDPQTMSFYPQPYSQEQVAAIIRSSVETYGLHGYGRFAVIEKDSRDYVGDCGITLQDIDGTAPLPGSACSVPGSALQGAGADVG